MKTQKPGDHRFTADSVLTMTAGFGMDSTEADPMTLRAAGLNTEDLKTMTEREVEEFIREVFEDFVWEAVGNACGWEVT